MSVNGNWQIPLLILPLPKGMNLKRFLFIRANSKEFSIAKMCKVLSVSTSGYYAWIKRPKSKRETENENLLKDIKKAHLDSNKVFGSRKIKSQIEKTPLKDRKSTLLVINHKKIERLMRENGIQSKTKKKYKATIDRRIHTLPEIPLAFRMQKTK